MKKIVIKVSVGSEDQRQKVLERVAKLRGVKDMAIDVEKGTLTVIGGVDPVCIIEMLRKSKCGRHASIDSVGDPPKPDDNDKDKGKDNKDEKKPCCGLPPCALPPCPPPMYGYMEYNPNPCVIL